MKTHTEKYTVLTARGFPIRLSVRLCYFVIFFIVFVIFSSRPEVGMANLTAKPKFNSKRLSSYTTTNYLIRFYVIIFIWPSRITNKMTRNLIIKWKDKNEELFIIQPSNWDDDAHVNQVWWKWWSNMNDGQKPKLIIFKIIKEIYCGRWLTNVARTMSFKWFQSRPNAEVLTAIVKWPASVNVIKLNYVRWNCYYHSVQTHFQGFLTNCSCLHFSNVLIINLILLKHQRQLSFNWNQLQWYYWPLAIKHELFYCSTVPTKTIDTVFVFRLDLLFVCSFVLVLG